MKSDSAPPPARTFLIDTVPHAAPPLDPGLYVTATPIGNLGDVTLRALRTLAAADFIACEDTRMTSRLTRHFGIEVPLFPYHEHNAERQRPRILAALAEGKAVALVSDAGTPLISDPGYRLVGDVVAAGYRVFPIPGPSAVIASLSAAGLPTDTFLFAGFLPPKLVARRTRLAELAAVRATLVFYEAPQRTAETLADMAETLGGARNAVVAREVTKMFETFRRDTLAALAAAFVSEPEPRGEITILVAPPEEVVVDDATLDVALAAALRQESVSAAAATVAAALGLPRKKVYARALALRGDAE